ncbi:flippase-like domain-containing protein [Candidatus Saccharibacteria bacterium]|nr:flippase-like domain-containing protein [Candidatus Saccharibacteria bacterium]
MFIVILLVGVAYFLYRSKTVRQRIKSAWLDLKKNFATYKKRPHSVIIGIICNFTGSFINVFALYASAHAIGVDLSLAVALLAYTFGNIAATLVPTPGGIGSTEAGLYSGLVLAGIAGPDAILITLLYRLISYWLPIVPGYYFFWGLRKNVLSNFRLNKKYSNQPLNS